MKKWLDRYDKGGPTGKKLSQAEIADIRNFVANNADVNDINDPRYYIGRPPVNKSYNVTNRLSASNLPRYIDPNVKNDPSLKWVNAAAMLGPIGVFAAPEIAGAASFISPYLTAPAVVAGTELAGVTPASIAAAYFAHEGYKKLPQTQASVVNAYRNPTTKNIINAANDVGWNTMDFLGLGEASKLAGEITNPISKLPEYYNKLKQPVNSINFSDYLTPKEAAVARAQRMLAQESKWKVNNPENLKDKFTNISNNFDEVYSYEVNKNPSALGTNSDKAYVFKDNGLSSANQARIAAHETGHFYRNMADEANEWNSFFDFSKLKSSTRKYLEGKSSAAEPFNAQSKNEGLIKLEKGVPHGDEIRERAAQLKDYIAQKNGIPLNEDFVVTEKDLDDAIKNYVKDTDLDNTMSKMLSSLIDKKGFLNAMNKRPLAIIPAAISGKAIYDSYAEGGDTTDYNFPAWQLANPIRASYHVVNPEQFHGPDIYKYPNHMTFSDESMYSTPEHMGGHWTELKNGKWQFQPSQWNIQNAGGKKEFLKWWKETEGKEGNKIKLKGGGQIHNWREVEVPHKKNQLSGWLDKL